MVDGRQCFVGLVLDKQYVRHEETRPALSTDLALMTVSKASPSLDKLDYYSVGIMLDYWCLSDRPELAKRWVLSHPSVGAMVCTY